MNHASVLRLDVAKELAAKYMILGNVEVAFVGGSVARGIADGHSDVDFGALWKAPPTDDERRQAIEAMSNLDTRFVRLFPLDPEENCWQDDFFIGQNRAGERASGLLVEVSHHTSDFLESVIRDVTEKFDPDPLKQNLLTGVTDSLAMIGENRIAEYRDRIRVYPDDLALAVINRSAQVDFYSNWKKFLRRGENLFLIHRQFCEIEEKLLRVCLALSRQYFSTFKWVFQGPDRLTVAPKDFLPRLRSVFSSQPEVGAEVLRNLVHETYDLIEDQFPEAKVDWWRSVFDHERSFWEEPPFPIRNSGP